MTVGTDAPDAATSKANLDAQKAQQVQQAQEAAQKAQAGAATDKLAYLEKPAGKDDPGYDRSNLRNLPDLRAGSNGADRKDKSDQAAAGTSDANEQALQNVRALRAKDASRRDVVDRHSAGPNDDSNPASAKQPTDASKRDSSPQDAGHDHGAAADRNNASGTDHPAPQTKTTHVQSQAEGASRQERSFAGPRDASGGSKTGYDTTILRTDGKREADAAHRPGPTDETYYDRANLRELPELRLGDQRGSVAEINWTDRLSSLQSVIRLDKLPEGKQAESPEGLQPHEQATVTGTEAKAAAGSDAKASTEPAAADSHDQRAQERNARTSGQESDTKQADRDENFRREKDEIKRELSRFGITEGLDGSKDQAATEHKGSDEERSRNWNHEIATKMEAAGLHWPKSQDSAAADRTPLQQLSDSLKRINDAAQKDPSTYLNTSSFIGQFYVRQSLGNDGYTYLIDSATMRKQGFSQQDVSALDKIFRDTGFAPEGIQAHDYLIANDPDDTRQGWKEYKGLTEEQADHQVSENRAAVDAKAREQAGEMLMGAASGICLIAEARGARPAEEPARAPTYEPRTGAYKPEPPAYGGILPYKQGTLEDMKGKQNELQVARITEGRLARDPLAQTTTSRYVLRAMIETAMLCALTS